MKGQTHIEESVDSLIKKLEGQGKKVKIIDKSNKAELNVNDEDIDDNDERSAS